MRTASTPRDVEICTLPHGKQGPSSVEPGKGKASEPQSHRKSKLAGAEGEEGPPGHRAEVRGLVNQVLDSCSISITPNPLTLKQPATGTKFQCADYQKRKYPEVAERIRHVRLRAPRKDGRPWRDKPIKDGRESKSQPQKTTTPPAELINHHARDEPYLELSRSTGTKCSLILLY